MKNVVFLTGAGISVPSGIPPYRGTGGIYAENPELEKLLTAATFAKNSNLVEQHVSDILRVILKAKPNEAHFAIAELDHSPEIDVTVITQNIDGLHYLAGSSEIIELHGNILTRKCLDCGQIWFFKVWHLGQCLSCESVNTRPNIVLFDEDLDNDDWNKAGLAIEKADIIVAVGTSGTVKPASYLLDIANDRAYKDSVPFFYLSLDRPEIYIPFSKKILGSAEKTVPELCAQIFDM